VGARPSRRPRTGYRRDATAREDRRVPLDAHRRSQGGKAVSTVAQHPHVKKIVPGPIDAGGTGSRTGLRAKATRAGTNGNIRLLLRDGSSVQENRIVTTAMDRETGERVREDLNEALRDAELQDE